MTTQTSDILCIDGDEFPLLSTPLDEFIKSQDKGYPFASAVTCNRRGYIATWSIEKDQLFLTALIGWVAMKPIKASHWSDIRLHENVAALGPTENWLDRALNPPAVPLDYLFPDAGDQVRASWFSGRLRAGIGRLPSKLQFGLECRYEKVLVLTIEQGQVVQRETLDGQVDRGRREAAYLVLQASGQAHLPAWVDRESLLSAIVQFAEAASFEHLEPSLTGTKYLSLSLVSAQIDSRVFQAALRELLNAEDSGLA